MGPLLVVKPRGSCEFVLQRMKCRWMRGVSGSGASAERSERWSVGYDHALTEDLLMTLTLSVGPLIALIAGILILVMPRLLNYIVALYLILIGLLGLFTHHGSSII